MSRTVRRLASCALALAVALAGEVTGVVGAAAPSAVAAGRPGYVAVVIQGGGTACVAWRSGITGDDVLNAVTSVHYRRDGLIDQIGGYPDPPKADDEHYWSYWHDTSGSWTYSSVGASGWQPAAGTVEGWAYVDGGSRRPPGRSAGGLYTSLCGARDAADDRPRTPRSTAAGRTERGTHAPASSRRARSATPPAPTAPKAPTASTPPSAAAPRTSRTPAASGSPATPAASATSVPPAAGTASTPLVVDATPAAGRRNDGGGSALPLVFGLALALLLGGAAGWTVLRRRREQS